MANQFGESLILNPLPSGSRLITFGHRSGAETHQRCPRAYYLNYEYLGQGINQTPTPIHLVVGSAIHVGLAAMLLEEGVDAAVSQAVEYLKNSRAFQILQPDQQIEQEVLVHGLLYAFWVWAMPSMQANYEVICVETGAVEYVPVGNGACSYCRGILIEDNLCLACNNTGETLIQYIAIQSRPDAILRNRRTGEVSGWSWKTIDDPTDMRRSQFHNDLQGFMEMHYGERILEKLAGAPVTQQEINQVLQDLLRENLGDAVYVIDRIMNAMTELQERAKSARNIPTQIDSIQTVFLVKGKRQLLDTVEMPWINSASISTEDDEYGGYAPDKIYKQMSHLCYRYRNPNQETLMEEFYKTSPNKGKPKPQDMHDPNLMDESWAYKFFKPNNSTQSGLSSKWLGSPIQPDQIREWVDRLAGGGVYPSTMNDERNPNPLDKLIRFETPLYRDALKAAGHVRQVKNRYVQIAEAVQVIGEQMGSLEGPTWEGAIQVLDDNFPQNLINCRTPYRCQFHNLCHTPAESQLDFTTVPEGFEVRMPHHSFERDARGQEKPE